MWVSKIQIIQKVCFGSSKTPHSRSASRLKSYNATCITSWADHSVGSATWSRPSTSHFDIPFQVLITEILDFINCWPFGQAFSKVCPFSFECLKFWSQFHFCQDYAGGRNVPLGFHLKIYLYLTRLFVEETKGDYNFKNQIFHTLRTVI